MWLLQLIAVAAALLDSLPFLILHQDQLLLAWLSTIHVRRILTPLMEVI
jgi:hypothetical protein